MTSENHGCGVLTRWRMKLAWLIAPRSVESFTWGRLEAIEDGARRIQAASTRPGKIDENAQAIERRAGMVKRHLGLEDVDD